MLAAREDDTVHQSSSIGAVLIAGGDHDSGGFEETLASAGSHTSNAARMRENFREV